MRAAPFSGAESPEQKQTEQVEYGPSDEGEMAELWRNSVFFHPPETGGSQFRVRFHAGELTRFPAPC